MDNIDNNLGELYCGITENIYSKEGELSENSLLISYDGTIRKFGKRKIVGVGDGTVTFRAPESELIGYADLMGKTIIRPSFYRAYNFHQGLAATEKIENSLGRKWGFIDKSGNYSISPRFVFRPSDFSNGLSAFINIKRQKGCQGGFISKLGDTVIRIGDETSFSYDFNRHLTRFQGDYFIESAPIVKKDGRLLNEQQFLGLFGLDSTFTLGYRKLGNQVAFKGNKGSGILFTDSRTYIKLIFKDITPFGEVYPASRAALYLLTDEDNKAYRVGLINKKGFFTVYFNTAFPD